MADVLVDALRVNQSLVHLSLRGTSLSASKVNQLLDLFVTRSVLYYIL